MKKTINFLIVIFFSLIIIRNETYTQIFVSPTGNDSAAGTFDSPYQTLKKALTVAGPDSLIYLRGGTYLTSAQITININGLPNQHIKIWAYPGEIPLFDFSPETSGDGISLKGSYLHLKDLEIVKAYHNGINISGHYNIIENCRVHDNRNSGIQMGSSSGTTYPSNNLVLNCDSYLNYDAPIGGNADGFAIKWNIGPGNLFKGCRAFNNSDDGFDLWMAIDSVTIDSCFAFFNGVDSWYSGQFNGNGNGFKLGGNHVATPHLLRNCVAFCNAGNTGRGFDENNNLAGQTLFNCTSFMNKGNNYHFTNVVTKGIHIIKNCISYIGNVNITSGICEANSWQGFSISNVDFVSLDTSLAREPRNPDGNLPENDFLHLAKGSSMIDAGVNVGLPFNGIAPDLGAFESNYPNSINDIEDMPVAFKLNQNYPNPFNSTTVIGFIVNSNKHTMLKVYNMLGLEIETLFNGTPEPGKQYYLTFDPSHLPSGVYYYRLEAEQISDVKQLIFIK